MNSSATEPNVYYTTEDELKRLSASFSHAALLLESYGRHTYGCEFWSFTKLGKEACTCGLEEAVNGLNEEASEILRRII